MYSGMTETPHPRVSTFFSLACALRRGSRESTVEIARACRYSQYKIRTTYCTGPTICAVLTYVVDDMVYPV
jgi:hypothetical protein